MAKLRRGAPPCQANFTVGPLIGPHPHQEEGTQMKEGLGFHQAPKHLQNINQARAQL